jgi:hypothetical protein
MTRRPAYPHTTPKVSNKHLTSTRTSLTTATAPQNQTETHPSKSPTSVSIPQDHIHDLQGIGSQFQDAGHGFPSYHTPTTTCPYHPHIIELRSGGETSTAASNRLEAYLRGDSWELYTSYYVGDTGGLSARTNYRYVRQRG